VVSAILAGEAANVQVFELEMRLNCGEHRGAFALRTMDMELGTHPGAEPRAMSWSFSADAGNHRRNVMPVVLLWAVPAIFVIGGLTYVLVR
jgi:hypothetical protein